MVLSRAFAVAGLVLATGAFAQASSLGALHAEVIYAPLSGRSGTSLQNNYPISYTGAAPSYLQLSAAWFPTNAWWGVVADAGVDTFVIRGDGFIVDAEPLDRRVYSGLARGGLTGRWAISSALAVQLELGWGYAAIPAAIYVPTSPNGLGTVSFWHTGPSIGLRGSYGLFDWLTLEGKANTVLASVGGAVSGLSASGAHLWVGLEAITGNWALPGASMSAVVGYEGLLARARAGTSAATVTNLHTSHRVFVGLRFHLGASGGRKLPVGPASISGQVLAADTGEPLSGVQVSAKSGTVAPLLATTDEKGRYRIEGVTPGAASVEVSAAGYRAARQEIEVVAGGQLTASLRVERKTGPGTISGVVRSVNDDGTPGAALAGAKITGPNGAETTAGADGAFTLSGVGPGMVGVAARLTGYQDLEEVVSVPPEGNAELDVALVKAKQKSLASIRGRVRSLKTGKPIAATLKIPEAQVATRAGEDGRFVVRLPGGRYSVVFSASGYVAQTKVVEVADGDQALFYVDMSPEER